MTKEVAQWLMCLHVGGRYTCRQRPWTVECAHSSNAFNGAHASFPPAPLASLLSPSVHSQNLYASNPLHGSDAPHAMQATLTGLFVGWALEAPNDINRAIQNGACECGARLRHLCQRAVAGIQDAVIAKDGGQVSAVAVMATQDPGLHRVQGQGAV